MKILVTGGSGFIGTNLIDSLKYQGIDLVNIDIKPPNKTCHRLYWRQCDILDLEYLLHIFKKFRPTHVIHLAARTDTNSKKIEDYKANTEGVKNILEAVKSTPSVERVIITSSQFVYGPPGIPKHDEDFKPIGAYGQSKVITEQLTRRANLTCIWTIIRPTNIWGPWHPRYPKEFWHVLKKGLYIHPGKKPVYRSYGYVGNVVWQIERILRAPAEKVHGRVLYLGDRPINLLEWVNGFSRAIVGKDVRIVPRWILYILALVGSTVRTLRLNFPIHLSRYRSMTQDYIVPIEPIFELFGPPPYSLQAGIEETVNWLKEQGFFGNAQS